MADDNAEAICREVYQETRDFYADKEGHLGQDAQGFGILHGPPVVNAPFLFLGYQPGGAKESGYPDQHMRWPEKCVYPTAAWPLAKQLRLVWSTQTLAECTGLNAIFFRARSAREWSKVEEGLRGEMEGFSRKQAERIVRALAPQRIVIIGLNTFRMLTAGGIALRGASENILVRDGELWGVPAFGIVHLSGARVSREDRDQLKRFFDDLP
jgi:hypothetical protein